MPAIEHEHEWQLGHYAWWPSEDRLIWSPELVRIYGLERAPVKDEEFSALVHPDDRVRVDGETSSFLGSSAGSFSHSFRIVRPDGKVRVVLDRGAVERDAAGRVRAIRGINIDVTDEVLPPPRPAAAARPEEARPEHAAGDSREHAGGRDVALGVADAWTLLDLFFDGAPVGLGVWDHEFRYLRVNRELAAINGLPPEDHIGRRPHEILPDFESRDEIYRSWRRILETGEPSRGLEISGETPAQPGRRKYWEADFFPVRLEGRNTGIAAIVQETTRRRLSEEGLRAGMTRQRALLDALDEGFCIAEVRFDASDGRADYRIVEANPAFFEHTGFPKTILGRWLREAAPHLEEYWYDTYGGVARTGEPVRFEQWSDALGRWFDVYAFRIDAPEDYRVAILFNDISERKNDEDRNRLLLGELDHRCKNLLSLVHAIARQTRSSGAEDFADRFGERLRALAVAHDLLLQHSWNTVPLTDLVRSQLAHFSDLVDARIEISGPSLRVKAAAVQTLSMALHELATNAAKHGALSNADGRIAVSWSAEPDAASGPRFTMSWRERGGPPLETPERTGFGSRVTREMVEGGTGGTVSVEYATGGLEWLLSCPSASVLDGAPD